MTDERDRRRGIRRAGIATWIIPSLYAGGALAMGVVLPRLEQHLWFDLTAGISPASAIAIYSTTAAGTMTLSAIVFSLTFVMVQFSATAYSPRLVLWLAEDPLLSHALGIFTGTFLYAIAAIAWVDREGRDTVPIISAFVVVGWLLASIGSFIALIKRIALLQVNRMLAFTGEQGRRVIAAVYPASSAGPEDGHVAPSGSPTQVLRHHGPPRAVQAVDAAELLDMARTSNARIDVAVAVGDTVLESMPLLRVYGGRALLSESQLGRTIRLGAQRTFEQDPQFAIRLLVDIAIRALSPAINDPTTAVQSLDEIGDLLLRIGRSSLRTAPIRDEDGTVRLVIPQPSWDDFLRLAFDEICSYGGSSLQVMRRMHALLDELDAAIPHDRREATARWRRRLTRSIDRHFPDLQERRDASTADRQGFGVSRPDVA